MANEKAPEKTDEKPAPKVAETKDVKDATDNAVKLGSGEFRSKLEAAASKIQKEIRNVDRQRKHLEATVINKIPIDREIQALKDAVNEIYQLAAQLPAKK